MTAPLRPTRIAAAAALALAGVATLVFVHRQLEASLDAMWPTPPARTQAQAPPVAAQHAALVWPRENGLRIRLPIGDHFRERQRVTALLITVLENDYASGWTSRAPQTLRAVIPDERWECFAALGVDGGGTFKGFNRWLLDPAYRERLPGCGPLDTMPVSYVPVRFGFTTSDDGPMIGDSPWWTWALVFTAGIVALFAGVAWAALEVARRPRQSAKTHDD